MSNYFGNTECLATGCQEGKYFEANLLDECKQRYVRHSCVLAVGSDTDRCEGTDLFWDMVRMDITSNFSGKDHVISLNKVYTVYIPYIGALDIRYGIRTGNSHHMFEVPVLVIGFDLDGGLLARFHDAVVGVLKKDWEQITETGEDLYWEFADANPGFVPDMDPFFA